MKNLKKIWVSFLLMPTLALSSLSTGCGENNYETVVDAIVAKDLDLFLSLLKDSDFETTLSGPGPFTVFATPDTVLTQDVLIILEDPIILENTIETHIVEGRYGIEDLREIATEPNNTITNINGTEIEVSLNNEEEVVLSVFESASIIEPNIEANNGVVHIITNLMDIPE